jgi:adenylosuccinate lyase
MVARNIFQSISPIDHRYSISESAVFEALVPWISEEALIASCVKAEISLVCAHLRVRGEMTDALKAQLEKCSGEIDPADVYAEEEKTHHNIRALVNVLKQKVPPQTAPLVHLGATSVDILDTSLSWRMAGVTREVVLPYLRKLEIALCTFTD